MTQKENANHPDRSEQIPSSGLRQYLPLVCQQNCTLQALTVLCCGLVFVEGCHTQQTTYSMNSRDKLDGRILHTAQKKGGT